MNDLQFFTATAVGAYIALLAIAIWIGYFYKRSNLFEPITFYLFFNTLFTLPLPVRTLFTHEVEGNVSPNLMDFIDYIPISVIYSGLTLPIFAIFYHSNIASKLISLLPAPPQIRKPGAYMGTLLLIGVSCLLLHLFTVDIGGFIQFVLLGYGSSSETFGKGYLAAGFPWLVVAAIGLAEIHYTYKSRIALVCGIVLFIGMQTVFLLTGNRSMIMYSAMAALIFYNYRVTSLKLKQLLPIALVAFLALNVMGLLRGSNYDDIGEFIDRTSSSFEQNDQKAHGLFYTLTIGEFVVPFETLPQTVKAIGLSDPPWLGLSYFKIPLYYIPSFLYPDRPPSLAQWYMQKFYSLGDKANEGRQFYFLSEGYLNFGWFGIFLTAAAWGLLWKLLYLWMSINKAKYGTVLLYSMITAFLFRCIAGDSVTITAGIAQQSLLPILFILATGTVFHIKPR